MKTPPALMTEAERDRYRRFLAAAEEKLARDRQHLARLRARWYLSGAIADGVAAKGVATLYSQVRLRDMKSGRTHVQTVMLPDALPMMTTDQRVMTTDQRVSLRPDARRMETSPSLRPEGATHPEYPLERVCIHRYEPCQLTFARHAQQVLAGVEEVEEVEAEASHRGLVLCGETEAALEQPVQVLRDYFGHQISVGEPLVRYHHGLSIEEPHMRLRVRCLPKHLDAVRADLESRDALIVRFHRNSPFGVLLATAPLARLLGYSRGLAQLTAGTGQAVLCLSHYDRMTSPVLE